MDTTVRVDYPDGNRFNMPERVNNLGLMNEKTNYLIFSGILSVVGLILAARAKKGAAPVEEVPHDMVTEGEPGHENSGNNLVADELIKLHALHEKGALSAEEFEQQKKRLLGS